MVLLSRRAFLRSSALAAAGVLAASCTSSEGTPQETPVPPTATPALEPTATSEPTATPEPTSTPEPTATPEPTSVPMPNEAPLLGAEVANGTLLPLEERLPQEPRAHDLVDGTGRYSDTLHLLKVSGSQGLDMETGLRIGMFGETNDGQLYANAAKGFTVSEDGTTFIFYLRRGLKWSDGEPFTTQDVLFWYEDDLLHEQIGPTAWRWWSASGKIPQLQVVDDYTFILTYPVANRPLINVLQYWGGFPSFSPTGTPAHYMKQYHIAHNPKVEQEAEAEGFQNWIAYYGARKLQENARYGAEKPVLAGWTMHEQTEGDQTFHRSPYYWGVDPEGHQLPYFDRTQVLFVEDRDTYDLKIATGETDFALELTTLANLSFYEENAETGGYLVHQYKSARGSDESFTFNRNSQDPVMRAIYQDPRWSQAMSYAIDRQEVNEVVFGGTGVPRQAAPNPEASYYKQIWGLWCAEHNPDKANALLDEMGLGKYGAEGYRLRPDGETLAIHVQLTRETDSPTYEVTQLVAKHWEKIGVKVTFEAHKHPEYIKRVRRNEVDVGVWHTDRSNEGRGFVVPAGKLLSGAVRADLPGTNEWMRWHLSQGKQGIEPPEEWKQHFQDMDAWQKSVSQEEYLLLAEKLFDFAIIEQLRIIGTVGFSAWPVVVQKSLGNFPAQGWAGDDSGFTRSLSMETWYRKQV